MGILDRFTSLIARRDQAKVDPKGPLALLPGDELSHYDTRYKVTGTRVLVTGERFVHQYCLSGAGGTTAVLVAGGDVAEGFALEHVRSDLDVAWDADTIPGPDEEQFRLANQGSCAVHHFGETGCDASRQVRFRVFEDEESGQVMSLEDFGGGRREIRVGDPVFEGEFSFHGGAGPDEERAWDTESEACDAQAVIEDEDDISRGSPMAAAMALDGRLAGATKASTYAEHDPTEFDDAEWSDAEDVDEPHSMLSSASTFAFSESAGWLEPTLYVAGAQMQAPEVGEDDWLKRDQASRS